MQLFSYINLGKIIYFFSNWRCPKYKDDIRLKNGLNFFDKYFH